MKSRTALGLCDYQNKTTQALSTHPRWEEMFYQSTIALNADGNILCISGEWPRTARVELFNLKTRQLSTARSVEPFPYWSPSFVTLTGNRLVTTGMGKSISFHNTATGDKIKTLEFDIKSKEGYIKCVTITPLGTLLICTSDGFGKEYTLIGMDPDKYECLNQWPISVEMLECFWLSNSNLVVIGPLSTMLERDLGFKKRCDSVSKLNKDKSKNEDTVHGGEIDSQLPSYSQAIDSQPPPSYSQAIDSQPPPSYSQAMAM